MSIVERILSNNKRLARYICTSTVRKCDKPSKKFNSLSDILKKNHEGGKKKKKSLQYVGKVLSPEDKQKAADGLNSLLKDLSVETNESENKDGMVPFFNDILKAQIEKKINKKKEPKENEETNLWAAAKKVAENFGGDVEKTKKELFEKLKAIDFDKEEAHFIEIRKFEVTQMDKDPTGDLKAIFSSDRLKIFTESCEAKPTVKLNIWDKLEEEDLAFRSMKPPRNQIEEWILWTEQGKLWNFPIDNDQGMEKEAEVDFTQHVFLEEHLNPWCPNKGPLKKFMTLVLVGLSKNPYLTVEEKKEHIFWYRDYFEKKKQLLQELGALGSPKEIKDSTSSQ